MKSETNKESQVVDAQAASSLDMEQADRYIDPAIQKRAMLKFDTVVLGCFGMMYLLANLDRNNLVSIHPKYKRTSQL